MNDQAQDSVSHPNPHPHSGWTVPQWLLGLLLVAVGVGLRLPLPQLRPMWADEAYSLAVARHSLAEIWQIAFTVDAHPPGYYALLHLWTRVFGDSLLSIRTLSDLVVLVGIIIAFLALRRLIDAKTAWVTALLMTISPFVCRLDEARNYCTMFLFGALALLVLSYAYHRRNWTAWLWAALVVIGSLYCSYNGLQVGLGLGLALLWLFRSERKHLVVGLLVFVALIAVASPPVVSGIRSAQVWAQYRYHSGPWLHLIQWGIRRAVRNGAGVVVGFHHHVWMELAALAALIATFTVIMGIARRGNQINNRNILTYALLLTTVALPGWLVWSGASIANRTLLMTSAYYTVLVPALYAVVALALSHGYKTRGWWIATGGIVVAMAAGHGLRYHNVTHQVDWSQIMSFVDERQQPGDVIAVLPPYVQLQAERHHKGPAAVTGVPGDFDVTRHRALSPEITLTPTKLSHFVRRVSNFKRVWLIETRISRYDPQRTAYNALRKFGQEIKLGLTEPPGNLAGYITLFKMPDAAATNKPSRNRM